MSFMLQRHGMFGRRVKARDIFDERFEGEPGLLVNRAEWAVMHLGSPDIRVSVLNNIPRAHSETNNERARAVCVVDPGPDQFVEMHVANITDGNYVIAHLRLSELLDDGTRYGYEFMVRETGEWRIQRRHKSTTVLVSGKLTLTSPLILRGEVERNTLRILVDGSQIGAVEDIALNHGFTGMTVRSRSPMATSAHVTRFISGTL